MEKYTQNNMPESITRDILLDIKPQLSRMVKPAFDSHGADEDLIFNYYLLGVEF